MRTLAEKNRDQVLALVAERLAFERVSVKLYEAVMEKLRREGEPSLAGEILPSLAKHRDEEGEHAVWLEARLRELGGDPVGPAETMRAAALEARGLYGLILSPTERLDRTLHALLGAELLDHAGWHVLVELAIAAGDEEARLELSRRLWEEDEHVALARRAIELFEREENGLATRIAPRAA